MTPSDERKSSAACAPSLNVGYRSRGSMAKKAVKGTHEQHGRLFTGLCTGSEFLWNDCGKECDYSTRVTPQTMANSMPCARLPLAYTVPNGVLSRLVLAEISKPECEGFLWLRIGALKYTSHSS